MSDEHGRTPLSSDTSAAGGDDAQWWTLFSEPGPPAPAAAPERKRFLYSAFREMRVAATAGAVAVIGAVLAWATWSPSDSGAPVSPQAATSVDQARSQQVRAGLPSGYAPRSCVDVAVAPGSAPLAVVQCGPGVDRDGPDSATFTLFGGDRTMTDAFDELVGRLALVDCPGDIQSPGPWRVSTGPQQARGILVCGFDGEAPVVGWTQLETHILSVVAADSPGSSMAELFQWWSRQS